MDLFLSTTKTIFPENFTNFRLLEPKLYQKNRKFQVIAVFIYFEVMYAWQFFQTVNYRSQLLNEKIAFFFYFPRPIEPEIYSYIYIDIAQNGHFFTLWPISQRAMVTDVQKCPFHIVFDVTNMLK